jgi:nucleotide-binding universal stress UspA family protein
VRDQCVIVDNHSSEGHMATTILPEPLAACTMHPRLKDPILLATDGCAQSIGAFNAAVAISAGGTRRTEHAEKLPVHVITVCGALPMLTPEMAGTMPHDFLTARRDDMLAAATEQVRYNVADTTGWRVEASSGSPAATIADVATEEGASLIVMGLGKHDLVARMFGSETALRVMQQSAVPVLAVPQNWIGIPRRMLVAVDFGAASLRAARTAMRIIAPGGAVCFAHVAPDIGKTDNDKEMAALYQQNLNAELDRFIAAVGVPDGVTITRAALYGDTAPSLIAWAQRKGMDTIVAGTHGLTTLARLFVGSVAASLVRTAQCALLIAAAPREMAR